VKNRNDGLNNLNDPEGHGEAGAFQKRLNKISANSILFRIPSVCNHRNVPPSADGCFVFRLKLVFSLLKTKQNKK
jgi:hypothetical protein